MTSPRSFSSQHLSMGSIAVVDTPGFHNPRHHGGERAATFEELCHNYVHERLQALFYEKTFVSEMERYKEVSARAAAVELPPSPRARLPASQRGETVSAQELRWPECCRKEGSMWGGGMKPLVAPLSPSQVPLDVCDTREMPGGAGCPPGHASSCSGGSVPSDDAAGFFLNYLRC